MLKNDHDVLIVKDALKLDSRALVIISGIIRDVYVTEDSKGKLMAFAKLYDSSGEIRFICFSDTYKTFQEFIQIGQSVIVSGIISKREGEEPVIVVSEIEEWVDKEMF
jgi:DNA polymerase III alpha subunit